MATARRIRTKADAEAPKPARRPNTAAAPKAMRTFSGAVTRLVRERHAAGKPYSTLNDRGEVVFVHPDGSIRSGRAADSPVVS
jgi:hypothetical protein